jgi:hypothetical protein
MTNDIEDSFVAACRQLGFQPDANAMRRAGTDLAGSAMAEGSIVMPDKRSISPTDFAKSLKAAMPESFAAIADKPATSGERRSDESMTDYMRRELAASRTRLPADFEARRQRSTGLTRVMLDARATKQN